MALAKLQRKPFGEDRSHFADANGDVREINNCASFQEKIPCKLQDIMKNKLDFLGNNSTTVVKWINSFAMAKTTVFQNSENAGAVSPRRICMICIYTCIYKYKMYIYIHIYLNI